MSTIVYLKFTAAQARAAARIFNRLIAPDDPLGDKFGADGWYYPAGYETVTEPEVQLPDTIIPATVVPDGFDPITGAQVSWSYTIPAQTIPGALIPARTYQRGIGPAYYYNFDLCFGSGKVRSTNPTGTDAQGGPIYTTRPGVHVNLLWGGPEETVPAQLAPYRVAPLHPAVVFG